MLQILIHNCDVLSNNLFIQIKSKSRLSQGAHIKEIILLVVTILDQNHMSWAVF